jgi:hypothetical protein
MVNQMPMSSAMMEITEIAMVVQLTANKSTVTPARKLLPQGHLTVKKYQLQFLTAGTVNQMVMRSVMMEITEIVTAVPTVARPNQDTLVLKQLQLLHRLVSRNRSIETVETDYQMPTSNVMTTIETTMMVAHPSAKSNTITHAPQLLLRNHQSAKNQASLVMV